MYGSYNFYICPECGEKFDIDDAEEVEESKNNNGCSSLIGIIIFIVIGYLIYQWLFSPKYTLFVCEDLLSPNNRYECRSNAFVFKDKYKSLSECYLGGNAYLSYYPGYECGFNCKIDKDFGAWVCKKINE